ncbi:MAG TPA: glycosyl hydrolase, partial [Prolixibacteraceae bacterium]|nr:glycosyl hydrolase [Prolixibacteraceae bacterium]
GRALNGPLQGGLLNGMLLDSWECYTQTWTNEMESEFRNQTGYELKKWLPAVFGYVINDQEMTGRFLRDWRGVIGDLFANRFYGGMSKLAKEKGLNIIYETAAGDVFPADIMEYYKYADVPMCEFWQPYSDSYVGALNFKPIKPTVSAARLYGKPRIAAEAFTSFNLTWDEHLSMLKEVANLNFVEGVTHLVFHTYTHNPRTGFLPPGTSFGSGIGTPFLRGQTWWRHMPEFTTYLSRLNYLFERGKPVSDVLWYLGDEINHKPDQEALFPVGFKYDYCNPDVLLNRLSVRDGKIVTPDGLVYQLIWLPDNERMLPGTLEKMLSLVREGAVIVGNPPKGLATLIGGNKAQERFDEAVKELWGNSGENIRLVGKGKVMSGIAIEDAFKRLNMTPDVTGGDALWLHRRTEGADWYYVCAPAGRGFNGSLNFSNSGMVEIWDPLTGTVTPAPSTHSGTQTRVSLDLPQAGSCFVVFRKSEKAARQVTKPAPGKLQQAWQSDLQWKLEFPSGWGAPSSIQASKLKAWKDLDLTPEAKAFSGTVTYSTTFDAGKIGKNTPVFLDLGRVEMIAAVSLNGKRIGTLWTPPYKVDLTSAVKSGSNQLTVEVTSTWFNRLVFDARQPEGQRKTWTIKGPSKDAALRESGLIGPVIIYKGQ